MNFKCKMCGGTIEFEEGSTVGVCDSCGTKQTLPRLSNDKKKNLIDRANHFRLNHDFKKAMMLYEQALSEDKKDAEIYWCLVLCRYGIDYVEDPESHKRIPTIHRSQYGTIYRDEDYQHAIQYADEKQKELYEAEAKEIEQIQKGILEISNQEEPFDVFICYKESDEEGKRTPDSVLATELYHELREEGFKVFFSRISLEEKIGRAYEPYIFAALHSAKVMVVIGTKAEYLNSVWVKNEWSRYLSLIEEGEEKVLIPAYRDMDPYELPEEFSHLQAQDMSKLGFMQDLIRGIKKMMDAESTQQVVKETVVIDSQVETGPLLRRAFIFLEDGEWRSANEYCERVLDREPENARAYLGKLMAEIHVKKEEDLKESHADIETSRNYQKYIRFADDESAQKMKGIAAYIQERNEQERLEKKYVATTALMTSAKTEDEYKEAAKELDKISRYKDAGILAKECREKAENIRKDLIYENAVSDMKGKAVSNYEKAIKEFEKIPGWKDTDEKIKTCQKIIDKLKEEEIKQRKEAEEIRKSRENKFYIGLGIIFMIWFISTLIIKVIIPTSKYNKAMSLMAEGRYIEAREILVELDRNSNSKEKIKEINDLINQKKYDQADRQLQNGNYQEAFDQFLALSGYRDSEEKAWSIYREYLKSKRNKNYQENNELAKELEAAKQYKLNKIESFRNAAIGDIITFGTYEQDNDHFNGKEEIEWIVLDKEDDRILVISKFALDTHYFHVNYKRITWEESSLRSWLNKSFIDETFDFVEQTMILEETTFEKVKDRIFILSIPEAKKYFNSYEDMKCQGTVYCYGKGVLKDEEGNCHWWLREPGKSGYSSTVGTNNSDDFKSFIVDNEKITVRPAMWLDLNP